MSDWSNWAFSGVWLVMRLRWWNEIENEIENSQFLWEATVTKSYIAWSRLSRVWSFAVPPCDVQTNLQFGRCDPSWKGSQTIVPSVDVERRFSCDELHDKLSGTFGADVGVASIMGEDSRITTATMTKAINPSSKLYHIRVRWNPWHLRKNVSGVD